MGTPFTELIEGRKACYKILEDNEFLAFLSETPIRCGHTLVIPKKECDALFELEDEHLGRLMVFAKRTARMIRSAVPCTKVGLIAAGIQVRHAHLHLVPIDQPMDLDLSKQKPASAGDLEKMQSRIKENVSSRI